MNAVVHQHNSDTAAFDATVLERVFDDCFALSERTRLAGGQPEPLYQPAPTPLQLHTVYYRQDYFASALHEVAHWCIAGPARRRLLDYGYWYTPEGRSARQQLAFENVEYQPQALEWIFAQACGYRFRVSADNFASSDAALPDSSAFCQRICDQARYWQTAGPPPRALVFFQALSRAFGTGGSLTGLHFCLDDIL